MGTPQFAVASLDALRKSEHQIVGVVTAEDKPAGRGQTLHMSDVKKYALEHDLPLLQPDRLRDEGFINRLQRLHADLFVVVAFRMLPKVVWSLPTHGTINLHASLLPDYRGAAPINHAIINGEPKTGVTTFFINDVIDTGDLLFREEVVIDGNETAGSLHDKLMKTGADLLVKTVNAIAEGNYQQVQQSPPRPGKEAPKIYPESCVIDWNKSAVEADRLIRGMSPYPGARTYIETDNGKRLLLKIYAAEVRLQPHATLPGEVYMADNHVSFSIACSDGWILPTEVQLEGKKRMPVADLLRGMSTSFRIASPKENAS